jgi:triacylglycerol lipase
MTSIVDRAQELDRALSARVYGRGVNQMAHSMGGLDCRYLISKVRPEEYTPLSLTTISTPHHGSPFMDWCAVRASAMYPRACSCARRRTSGSGA